MRVAIDGATREQVDAKQAATFEQLFRRYHRPLRQFFSNRGFSSDECRDLTQETFLGAYKGLARYRGEASEDTWIFKIAGNVWKNAVRDRSATKRDASLISLADAVDEEEPIAADRGLDGSSIASDPLASALADERRRLLRDAVEELPDQMRTCVFLRIYQEMKYREIATVMNISINTVKSQLHQAQESLRQKLSEYFPEISLEEEE